VGYDGDERYRVWIKGTISIALSRDVVFEENLIRCVKSYDDSKSEASDSFSPKTFENTSDQSDYEDEFHYEDENHSEDSEEVQSENPKAHSLRDRTTLKKPSHLEDYVLISEVLNERFNPETYEEAISCKEKEKRKEAMLKEMESLQENNIWEVTKLPQNKRAIKCKWVYRVKENPDGSFDKYKARLVVDGFSQQRGVYYKLTFSPVAKWGTIRAAISTAAMERM
jgi:hypothetical protein